jgi:hypothetical protein
MHALEIAMKGINTSGKALNSGGVASFSAPRDGVSHLAFPALSRERNHHDDSFPLAPLGNHLSYGIQEQKASPRHMHGCLPFPFKQSTDSCAVPAEEVIQI